MGLTRERGIKIIKKTGRVFAWIFGILLVICVGAYFALKSPACQTWMAQRAAGYLSGELKTKVTIRAVDIEFFKKVNLEGIYVEDQHGDTLLFAEQLKVDIHNFSLDNHYLSISSVKLTDSKIKLKKYEGEHGLSYRFIQRYFKSTDTTKTTNAPWKVEVGGVTLDNVTFAFIDTRDTMNDPGMDYENIRVTGIKALFTDIDPMGDSLSLRIKGLQGNERCGFSLKDFNTRLTVADTFAHFDNLHFITPGSAVDGFISFYFASTDDIADDFIHLVKMDGHFSSSIIEMGDVAYFAPELLGMKKKVLLTGDIRGTVEHLKCKNVDIRFGDKSHIAGNFSFNGLPNMEETDMNFKIREALTNRKDLEGIPSAPFSKGGHLQIPENIGKLGDMTFNGSFEGFLNDFVAHGKFKSALGSLALDNLSMSRTSDTLEYSYVGGVHASHFNLGNFYDIPDLTFVTGDVNIEGSGLANSSVKALIDGNISELVYHGYSYTGITVSNGKLSRQVFDGDFKILDPNLRMTFNGKVDNSNPNVPDFAFDANIEYSNLGELGFLDKDHEQLLSTDLHMKFKGNNIDNLDGRIIVENLLYKKDGEKFSFNEFTLVAGNNADKSRTIFLESDIVRATLQGKFQLLQLPHAISDMMSTYLPSYFPPDHDTKTNKDPIQQFNWSIIFQNNTKPIQALIPQLEIAPFTSFTGKFDGYKKEFSTTFNSPSIYFKNIGYVGIHSLNANNTSIPGICLLTGTMDELKVTDTIGTKGMNLECRAYHDSLLTHITWDNKTVKKNDGNIVGLLHFENQKSFKIGFLATTFHLNDSLWTVAPGNFVRLDSNRISFHELVFHSGVQSIGLNGYISPNPNDQLNISLKEFNIAYLNYFTVQSGVTIKGTISSETGLTDLYDTPIFTSNTEFKDFMVNGQELGDGGLDANWQKAKQGVYVHGHFSRGVPDVSGQLIDNILFEGFYYPKNKENSIDITAAFANIPLDVFTPILEDFCSQINGKFSGNLEITGTPSKPLLNGKMNVFPRYIKVDYLGLALSGPQQPIYIEDNSFFFDDFKITDGYSDTAKIYGHLFHDNFKNFQFDMDFSFEHFMVLNTTASQNELYYGRVFSTGFMNIFGFVDENIRIDMSARTDKIYVKGQPLYSEFNVPMTSTSEVGTNEFITFVDKKNVGGPKKSSQLKNNGIELHMNVEATPDCIVKVVFDKTVGDELTAYGNGSLKMDITPAGDFTIFGQYTVDKGNYLFTMKNVLYVPFELAKGGVISWNGDPYLAQINADAVYKATASVEPFFPMDSVNQAYHRSYPVDVVMHMDSSLMNPTVSFDINLPTADQTIQETVASYIQTDLERNRQVLSLMVLNSFMTPTELRDGASTGPNYGNAGSTLLSNFVSGTLNNWLSQISTDFNMGLKYRPNDDLSTQELKVYLQTQLLNNKITIDGNVGKVNANQATSSTGSNGQWVGDVNVEYKVTDDGKIRLRAFNRSNDASISVSNSAYTQGVGVFYREEFETGKQLKNRYKGYFKFDKKKKPSKDSTGK